MVSPRAFFNWHGLLETLRVCTTGAFHFIIVYVEICLYLPPGDFLHQSSMSRYPGAQVNFSCIEGHVLVGASSTTCHNGTWSNEIPTCVDGTCVVHNIGVLESVYGCYFFTIALCPHFPSIPHLHYLHIPSRHINTTVFLECETGWRLIGSASVTCQPNQTWSPELPHCEALGEYIQRSM